MNECRQLALPSPAASAEPCAGPAACGYFESGLYHRNLKRFADLGMRVRVFVYEELLSRPHETEYDEVFRAIGAPPHASKKRIKGFRNEYETQLSDVPLEWRCAMANAYRDDLELLYGFLGRRIAAWDQAHADCRASPDDGPSTNVQAGKTRVFPPNFSNSQSGNSVPSYLFNTLMNRADVMGTFVEFGCADGTKHSTTYAFEQMGWKGLCIEPNYHNFVKAKKARTNAIFSLVTGKPGNFTYAQISGKDDQLSGIVEFYSPKYKELVAIAEKRGDVEYMTLPGSPLETLLASHGFTHVDWISVDCEGCEASFITNFDFTKWGVQIVNYEPNTAARMHTAEIEAAFKSHGFIFDRQLQDRIWRKPGPFRPRPFRTVSPYNNDKMRQRDVDILKNAKQPSVVKDDSKAWLSSQKQTTSKLGKVACLTSSLIGGLGVTAIVMGEDSRVQDEFTRAGLPYARLPEPCDAAAGNMTDDECALLKIRHCTHVGPILPGMCGCRGKIGGIAISHLRAWEHALRTRPDARFHFFTEQDVKFHGASDVDGALRAVLDEAFRRAPSWRVIWFSSAKNCEPGPDVTWSKKWLASHSDMPFAKAVTHKIFCGASGLHRWDAQSWEPDPASPILNHQTGAPFSLRRKWTISNVQTESWNVAYALSKRGIRTLVQRARTHGFLEPVDQSMAGTCDDGTCLTHFSNSTFGIVDYESGGQASGSRRPPPSSHPRSRRSPPRKGRSPPLWRRRAARPHSGFTRNPERAGGRAVA